ncbi:hypothetical protein FACS189468_5580 [Spirochaetia bacterium]|nr:hypothetical protein FACS189468_5580 [Spirochaetia bacterium]
MANKINKYKETKLYCIRKNNLYVSWDGKAMVEKPQDGIRVSRTRAERKYAGFEMIPFPDAYDQWYQARKEAKA